MRTTACVVCAGVMALAGVSIAKTKEYHITLADTTAVGSTQLKPGDYTVAVQGSNAIIKSEENSASVTIPVKVESAKQKFDETAIDSIKAGSVSRLKAIDIGGSKTELEF